MSLNFNLKKLYYILADQRRIRMFLILCKNSLERTKEALDQYYTIKTMVPEYFANRDPTAPEVLRSMETSLVFIYTKNINFYKKNIYKITQFYKVLYQ